MSNEGPNAHDFQSQNNPLDNFGGVFYNNTRQSGQYQPNYHTNQYQPNYHRNQYQSNYNTANQYHHPNHSTNQYQPYPLNNHSNTYTNRKWRSSGHNNARYEQPRHIEERLDEMTALFSRLRSNSDDESDDNDIAMSGIPDSYAKYIDLPTEERVRLHSEVFDFDNYLFHQVVNKFLPKRSKRLRLKTKLSDTQLNVILPKACSAFNLKLIHTPQNTLILRKVYTADEIQEQKRMKEERKRIREGRKTEIGSTKAQVKKVQKAKPQPISSDNIGHRMLQAMGWKQGETLGANGNGLLEPIQQAKRHKRRGLGA